MISCFVKRKEWQETGIFVLTMIHRGYIYVFLRNIHNLSIISCQKIVKQINTQSYDVMMIIIDQQELKY